MDLVIKLKEGATNKDIAAELRFQAGLLDGMKPKQAASRENTDADESADDDADDDFTAKAVKAKAGKKAKGFDEDEDDTEEKKAKPENDDDAEEEKPKGKKTKKITIDDVNDACKAKANESSRKDVLKILDKKFGVSSVTDLEPEQYSKVIAAMQA